MARTEPEWLAGLLEGEGSFGFNYAGKPCVQVQMSDKDVVADAARMMGGNLLGPYTRPSRPDNKPMYHAKRVGRPAAEVMRMVWPWMGERRSGRIAEVLGEPKPLPRERGTLWLAGLLEGEGAFWRSKQGYSYVKLLMTDEDVVRAASKLVTSRATVRPVPAGVGARKAHWKPAYVYTVGGSYADAIMRSVHPFMGLRRRKKIESLLGGENVS